MGITNCLIFATSNFSEDESFWFNNVISILTKVREKDRSGPEQSELAKQILSCGVAEQKLQERLGTNSLTLSHIIYVVLTWSLGRKDSP